MKLRDILLPQDKEFYNKLESLARKTVDIAALLMDLKENYSELPQRAKKAKEIESKADAIVNQIDDRVNSTFITPIDREDIVALAEHLDNVVDDVEDAIYQLSISGISFLPSEVSEFSGIIYEAAVETSQAVLCLTQTKGVSQLFGKSAWEILHERCLRIKELEKKGDNIHRPFREGLSKSNPRTAIDLLRVLILKEILDCLEKSMDEGFKKAAAVLKTIRVKYA